MSGSYQRTCKIDVSSCCLFIYFFSIYMKWYKRGFSLRAGAFKFYVMGSEYSNKMGNCFNMAD